MSKKKIVSIIGARPQFIKHAPMQLALQKIFNTLTVHTGQHYDSNMSDIFFEELKIKKPDYHLKITGKTHGRQTAEMIIEIEKILLNEVPDSILVYGDTNSTLAGVIAAAKLNIPIIHIEAGLRSFNRSMPEEINRIIADEFSTLLFCPTKSAIENLSKEGINHSGIFLSGDVMCDSLQLVKNMTRRLYHDCYYFATLHRPYNTDDVDRLMEILSELQKLKHKVIFPIHPRTVARMTSFGLDISLYDNIQLIEPIGYIESLSYQQFSEAVITDSGGMQKEAYMLKKKCITLRSETEWVETLENGWNTLVFDNLSEISRIIDIPPSGIHNSYIYGNGNASEEIVDIIKSKL